MTGWVHRVWKIDAYNKNQAAEGLNVQLPRAWDKLLLLLYRNCSNMGKPDLQTRWSKQATQQAVVAEERLPRLQRNLWSFSQTYVLSIRWRYWAVFGMLSNQWPEVKIQPPCYNQRPKMFYCAVRNNVWKYVQVLHIADAKLCVSERRLTIVRSKTVCIAMIISAWLIVSTYATNVL